MAEEITGQKICPAVNYSGTGAPLFKKISLQLENGNIFEINAPDNSDQNYYIKNGSLNGKDFNQNWLDHTTITEGGKLLLEMDRIPNKTRGTDKLDRPFSMSLHN